MKNPLRLVFVGLTLAATGAAQDTAAPWKRCDSEIEWLSDGRSIKDQNQGARDRKVDAKDVELLEQAKAKAKESGRLILWYIPQVAGQQMYRPMLPDNYMKAAVWTDERIVDLVRRRFVPLRNVCTPAMTKETKVGRWEVVEPAIAILNAEGALVHVLQRIRTFNAGYIHSMLRAVLAQEGKFAASESTDDIDELIKGGDYDRATNRLMAQWKDKDPVARLQMAKICQGLRMGEKAIRMLDEAAQQTKDAELLGSIATERGEVLLAQGKIEEAKAQLEKAAGMKSSRAFEAEYYLAVAERFSGKDESAMARWEKLASEAAETRWGWRASANVKKHRDTRPIGPAPSCYEDVFWSHESAYGLRDGTCWPRTEKDVDDIARRAVTWLLRAQTASGGWTDTRYAYWPSPAIIPNVRVAVTSLAAAALLEWRSVDPARADAAVAAAEKYLLDDENLAKGKNEECYAQAYRLVYLTRKHATLSDEKARATNIEHMNAVAKRLATIQTRSGFWAHEYPNPFCSAAVLQPLQAAKKAGAEVADEVLEKATSRLKSTRGSRGRQPYGGGGGASRAQDSSARSAMCDGVLLDAEIVTRDDLATALSDFWKYLKVRERIRVCDFHSIGELGGFFFFHGFFHTTETFRLLDEKARDENASKALAHLVKIPEIDGSFLDSHEMGKSYGTAMALLSLKNVLRK